MPQNNGKTKGHLAEAVLWSRQYCGELEQTLQVQTPLSSTT